MPWRGAESDKRIRKRLLRLSECSSLGVTMTDDPKAALQLPLVLTLVDHTRGEKHAGFYFDHQRYEGSGLWDSAHLGP